MTVVDLSKHGYVLRLWPFAASEGPSSHVIEFEALVSLTVDMGTDGPVFQARNADVSPVPTENIDEAEWHVRGSVKWDGCCNYTFNQERCMLHVCGPHGVENERQLMLAVYREAAKLMPETCDYSLKEQP